MAGDQSLEVSQESRWEELRKDARKIEGDLDVKLSSYAKLGARFSQGGYVDTGSPTMSSSRLWKSMEMEIQLLLEKLLDVNDSMSRCAASAAPTTSVTQMLARHRDILHEFTQEFRRIKGNKSSIREHAELLTSVRDDISEDKASGSMSPRMQMLRERAAIHGNISHMSSRGRGDRTKRPLVEPNQYDLIDYSDRLYIRRVAAFARERGPTGHSNPSIPVSNVREASPYGFAPPSLARGLSSNEYMNATERRLFDFSHGYFSPSHFPLEHSYRRHEEEDGEKTEDEDRMGYGSTPYTGGCAGIGHSRGGPGHSRGPRMSHHEDQGQDHPMNQDENQDREQDEDRDQVRDVGVRGGRGYGRAGPAPPRGRGEVAGSFPGGPQIPYILSGFVGHVAHAIWNGEERGILKFQQQTERISAWTILDSTAQQLIASSKLLHLTTCMFRHHNLPLISAFVERWHPETNSFHLPFGEMTVTLHDVWYILRIPVQGKPLISNTEVDVIKYHAQKLLGMTTSELNDELKASSVKFTTLRARLSNSSSQPHDIVVGYLLYLLGASLFIDKSGTRVSLHFMPFLEDIGEIPDYAWGAATLAFLYHHLGMASRADCKQIAGCMTLLEGWIYEYFPTFRPMKNHEWRSYMPYSQKWVIGSTRGAPHQTLQEYRRLIDGFTPDVVNWTPFKKLPAGDIPITLYRGIIHCRTITEPYMPDRCLRQFGYLQYIPKHDVIVPGMVYRGRNPQKYKCVHELAKWSWNAWDCCLVRPETEAQFPDEAGRQYLHWFTQRSHPKVTAPHDEPEDDSDDDPANMPPEARLQFVASRMKFTSSPYRHDISDEQYKSLIDEVNNHLKDLYF